MQRSERFESGSDSGLFGQSFPGRYEATIKWYDRRRAFGFCCISRGLIDEALATLDAPLQSELSGGLGAGADVVDVFFGQAVAEAAMEAPPSADGSSTVSPLALARGERVLCSLGVGASGKRRHPSSLIGAEDASQSQKPRLEARCLRRPGASSTSLESTAAAEASAKIAFELLTTKVREQLAPELLRVNDPSGARYAGFSLGAAGLLTVLHEAQDEVALRAGATGRQQLEAFVQGPCFDAVQGFGRHALLMSDRGSISNDAEAHVDARRVVSWIGELVRGQWCWTVQQRRHIQELQQLAAQFHHSGEEAELTDRREDDMSAALADDSRFEAVLAQRTSRFVVVLEGVRNSANQLMIFRTCEALGVQEVWLVPPPAGVKYRAAMVRSKHASRGAERLLTFRRLASAAEVAAACTAEGRELWVSYCPPAAGLDQDSSGPCLPKGTPCEPLALSKSTGGQGVEVLPRLALVLGTEAEGVSEEMLRLATRAVFLPTFGLMQSLNVAVACGMLVQRLFDLCPSARGDLTAEAKVEARARYLALGRGCTAMLQGDGLGNRQEEADLQSEPKTQRARAQKRICAST